MKYLLIILSLFIFSCQTKCEDKKEHFDALTRPIVVIRKDISEFYGGYCIDLQDKKGYRLSVIQFENCTFSDTLVNNYNFGDTIK